MRRGDLNRAAVVVVFYGVSEEVGDHLADAVGIAQAAGGRQIGLEFYPAAIRQRANEIKALAGNKG